MLFSLLRRLPHFKGKFRLVNFLFGNKLKTLNDVQVSGKWGCKYNLPNLTEAVAFDIYVDGVYEPDTIAFITDRLTQNATFLDLGINIGAITIPVKRLRPDVKIIGVEASPWVFSHLEKNLALNKIQDVVTFNNALFDSDGEMIEFYSPQDGFGKGSLSPVFTSSGTTVSTITLDTLVRTTGSNKVDLIKIDVEGYEYYVFKGGQALLTRQDAPEILFEFVDWAEERARNLKKGEAQQLLMNYGYSIYKLENGKVSETPLEVPVTSGSYLFFATRKRLG